MRRTSGIISPEDLRIWENEEMLRYGWVRA